MRVSGQTQHLALHHLLLRQAGKARRKTCPKILRMQPRSGAPISFPAPLRNSSSLNPGRPVAHAEVEDLTSLLDSASFPESSGWPQDNQASEANPQTVRATSSGRNVAVAADEQAAFHFQDRQWKAHRGKPKEPLHYLPVNLVMIHDITTASMFETPWI